MVSAAASSQTAKLQAHNPQSIDQTTPAKRTHLQINRGHQISLQHRLTEVPFDTLFGTVLIEFIVLTALVVTKDYENIGLKLGLSLIDAFLFSLTSSLATRVWQAHDDANQSAANLKDVIISSDTSSYSSDADVIVDMPELSKEHAANL